MVTGMALFTLNDAMGKWLVETCPVPLILAVRSAAALLILLPLVMRAGFSSVFRVPDPGRHLLRNTLIVAEVAFFYLAVRELPLADVMTIYMAAPLLVTALSVPLLGEKVGVPPLDRGRRRLRRRGAGAPPRRRFPVSGNADRPGRQPDLRADA